MEREAVSRDAQTGTPAALVDRPAGILRLPDEAPTLKDADELTRRKALADWLAERGKDHFQDRIAPAILRRAAGQLWTDRQEARRQGVAAPGQAEYLDLRLYPFWEDAQRLVERLHGLPDRAGLQVVCFEDGPDGVCRPYRSDGRDQPCLYRLPEAGTPLLMLSDLGLLDARTDPWLAFGRRLKAAGMRPVRPSVPSRPTTLN